MRRVDVDKVAELYKTGFSLREIERLTGVPYGTARDRLIKAGVELRSPGGNRREPSHAEYARTAFFYERLGWSTNEIAEALGLAHDTVCNRLDQHGVRRRSRGESARLRFARRPKARAAA